MYETEPAVPRTDPLSVVNALTSEHATPERPGDAVDLDDGELMETTGGSWDVMGAVQPPTP